VILRPDRVQNGSYWKIEARCHLSCNQMNYNIPLVQRQCAGEEAMQARDSNIQPRTLVWPGSHRTSL
jgi:hypothetical protein